MDGLAQTADLPWRETLLFIIGLAVLALAGNGLHYWRSRKEKRRRGFPHRTREEIGLKCPLIGGGNFNLGHYRLCTTERKNGVLNQRTRGTALDEPAGF
jgi:hypothetical protein